MRPVPPLALALALSACGSAPPPPAPITHQSARPPGTTCLPSKFKDGAIAGFSVRDGHLRLCLEVGYESADRTCILLDRDGHIVDQSAWVDPDPATFGPEHEITAKAGSYTICAQSTKRCTSFPATHPTTQAMPEAGVVSADGALAFLLHDRPHKPTQNAPFQNEIVGELYDTRGGRVLGSIKLTSALGMHGFSDTGMTRAVGILSPRLIFVGAYPAGPGGVTALVDLHTGKGIPLHGFGGDNLVLDDRTLLVLDDMDLESGEILPPTLSIIDMTTLTTVQKLTLPAGKSFDEPERISRSMNQLGGTVLIASTQPARVTRFDPATRRLSAPQSLPLCPP